MKIDSLSQNHRTLVNRERDTLINRFNTFRLNRKQTAQALNTSVATLDRLRNEYGTGPRYHKGPSRNSPILYPVSELAEYIVTTTQRTF